MRRPKSPRRQHNRAAGVDRLAAEPAPDLHAGDPAVLDDQLLDQRLGPDRQIGPTPRRLDIGPRRRPAFTVLLGDLVDAHALLLLAVEIVENRQLQIARRLDKGEASGIEPFLVGYRQRAVAAVIGIAAALVAFGFPEIGQDIIIGPAAASHRRPIVIIPFVAADIDHRVDRARSAQSASAWLIAGAAVQPFLRHRVEPPVGVLQQERHHPRRLDQKIVVPSAGLNQADRALAVLAQPSRDCTTGGTAADDDDVKFCHRPVSLHIRFSRILGRLYCIAPAVHRANKPTIAPPIMSTR